MQLTKNSVIQTALPTMPQLSLFRAYLILKQFSQSLIMTISLLCQKSFKIPQIDSIQGWGRAETASQDCSAPCHVQDVPAALLEVTFTTNGLHFFTSPYSLGKLWTVMNPCVLDVEKTQGPPSLTTSRTRTGGSPSLRDKSSIHHWSDAISYGSKAGP